MIVTPAAGVVIREGGEASVLRLPDQVFMEPAWIPIFLAGLVYNVDLILVGLAVWRSTAFPRVAGPLVVAAGAFGIPAFLDVTIIGNIAAVAMAAAARSLAARLWRRAGRPA